MQAYQIGASKMLHKVLAEIADKERELAGAYQELGMLQVTHAQESGLFHRLCALACHSCLLTSAEIVPPPQLHLQAS